MIYSDDATKYLDIVRKMLTQDRYNSEVTFLNSVVFSVKYSGVITIRQKSDVDAILSHK